MLETTRPRAARRWLAALAGALVLGVSAPAASQSSADELARKHFESGVAYLQESDYASALQAFQKAYDLSKRAEILINIATVHERAGDLRAAVSSLERYLELEPNGKHADTIKLRLANLKKRVEEGTQPPPDAGAASTSEPSAQPPPTAAPPPAPSAAPPPPVVERAEPNRIPAYVAFGIGGLAAAGAIVTGVLAQREYDDAKNSCAPSCSDDDVSSGKNLALISTIATGIAIVGAGIGAVLWFTAGPVESASASSKRPRFGVALGGAPGGAQAHAVWSF